MPEALSVIIEDETGGTTVDPESGSVSVPTPEGGVVVQLDALRRGDDDGEEDFYDNLAEDMDEQKLSTIANDLFEAVSADDASRSNYLATRARGLDYLGLKLPDPKSSVNDGASPIEGMSSVTNPLLLEAILKGWASTVGELLPANGPVKIRDDGEETALDDIQADALERDFNHYLTKVATEYYPDTSHMILWGPYFGGSGFKKIYRCPMRRRPVSESVDPKDLIVSDTTKDLRSCARITHAIEMRPSVMKRMQLLGAYRDVTLTQPVSAPNTVDEKIAGIQGTQAVQQRPEDQPYNLWETQCELDLDEYAPAQFKGKGLPLPYIVTMDRDSREILALRRDWREDDEECERKRIWVKYPYVPGPGFYGTGLLNILGNASAAMTAAWREALDAGMFASFPGGLIAKMGNRQNTTNIRVSPGEFAPIETSNMPISQVVMGMPYRDVTPGLMTLIDKVTAQAKEVGGTADIPAAEGIQNVPVGTMLAQIEQATKVMAAAHKGMHQAQSEEFDLILGLFRDCPDDFVRCSRIKNTNANPWTEQTFLAALANCNLVPVSDPNVPSHIHRVAKALALIQLYMVPGMAPRMDSKELLLRCLRAIKEDPNGLVVDPPPQQAQPNPDMLKAQAQMVSAQSSMEKARQAAITLGKQEELKQLELQAQERHASLELAREMIIHQADQAKIAHEQEMERTRLAAEKEKADREHAHEREKAAREHGLDHLQFLHDMDMDHRGHAVDVFDAQTKRKQSQRKAKGFASGGAVVSTDYLLNKLIDAFEKMAKAQSAERRIVRDPSTNKPIGVRIVDADAGGQTLN